MLLLADVLRQLLFERVTMFVVPALLEPAQTAVVLLFDGAPLPPVPPGAPLPPVPPVGLSWAMAMPPAVAARAVAPKAATIAFRVFMFLAFLIWTCYPTAERRSEGWCGTVVVPPQQRQRLGTQKEPAPKDRLPVEAVCPRSG